MIMMWNLFFETAADESNSKNSEETAAKKLFLQQKLQKRKGFVCQRLVFLLVLGEHMMMGFSVKPFKLHKEWKALFINKLDLIGYDLISSISH